MSILEADSGERPSVTRALSVSFSTAILVLLALGCRSTTPKPPMCEASPALEHGVELLNRPLPGPMVALYRMKVPSSGGFRFSVAAVEDGVGRMTISEPFGAAVVLAGWEAFGQPQVFDLREGCRMTGGGAARDLGLGDLPLLRTVRLLGGRLPMIAGDSVEYLDDCSLEISTDHGLVRVTLRRDPWRVIAVEGTDYSVTLDSHTSSLPGRVRFESSAGETVVLELVRLQWEHSGEWAPMPDLPVCGSR